MFTPSTHLWHPHRDANFSFRERRLVHVEVWGWEAAKGFAGKVGTKVEKGWNALGVLTWPLRAPFIPAHWLIKKTWNGMIWTANKTREGVLTAFEGSKSIAVDAVGKPMWRLAKTPLADVKMNLVDNTREITKGIFQGIYNVIRTPDYLLRSIGQSAKSVFTGGWEVAKSLRSFSPSTIASATRHAIGGVIAPPAFRELMRLYKETPINTSRNVLKNILESKWQYFTAIPDAARMTKEGIMSVGSAHARALEDMDEYRKKALAKKAELDAKPTEATKTPQAERAVATPARAPAAPAAGHGGGGHGHAPAHGAHAAH